MTDGAFSIPPLPLRSLTNISGLGVNVTYNYTAGANNGRIASTTDSGAGETVTYQYDSLNRLIAANSTAGWNTTYGYDGWGNLNNKGGSSGVPYISITTDPSTNGCPGITGVPYSKPSAYSGGVYIVPQYDVEGHQLTDGGQTWWVYDPWGRRIWQETLPSIGGPVTTCKLTFYATTGKRIAGFAGSYMTDDGSGHPGMSVTADTSNPYALQQLSGTKVYFGNKLIMSDGNMIGTDRLGSVRSGGTGGGMNYYPYGEERTSTPQGQEKFGTYTRDADGNDYAMARRYSSSAGRFLTADPGGLRAAVAGIPGSWNRMGYSLSDPINRADPSGLCSIDGVDYPDGAPPCPDITSTTVNGSGSGNGGLGGGGGSGAACPNGNEGDGNGDDEPEPGPCFENPGYSGSAVQTGLSNAIAALKNVAALNLNSTPCQSDLNALAHEQALVGNMGSVGQLVSASAIQAAAKTAASYVYNGNTSSTLWSVADFGTPLTGMTPFPGETVGGVFRFGGPNLIALSQMTGYAIFVNANDWAGMGADYETATMLHELIHKFGLTDGQMGAALETDISGGSSALTTKLQTDCLGH